MGRAQARAEESATWALVYFYFISFGGFLALTAWLPTYWTQTHAVAFTTAGLLTLMFSLLTALIRGSRRNALGPHLDPLCPYGELRTHHPGGFAGGVFGSFAVAVIATIMIAAGMGLQNAIVFKLVAFTCPAPSVAPRGWVGGLGALSGVCPAAGSWAPSRELPGATSPTPGGFLVIAGWRSRASRSSAGSRTGPGNLIPRKLDPERSVRAWLIRRTLC